MRIHNRFRFNFAALAIVPISAINAYTAEQQIDALYAVADDPTCPRDKSEALLRLIGKMWKKLETRK